MLGFQPTVVFDGDGRVIAAPLPPACRPSGRQIVFWLLVARVEAGPRGVDTRFIVTSLHGVSGRTVYQDISCARGQAANHIKAYKTHLAADRTSRGPAAANQMRRFLHAGGYWLMRNMLAAMPPR